MERLAALSRYDVAITADLPDSICGASNNQHAIADAFTEEILDLAELERNHILRVLERLNGNKSRAAQLLGLDRRTLYRKLDLYRAAQPGPAPELLPLAQLPQ
jgi:transcriptional regulator of acetoin/glycerol metabolism